MSIEVNPDIKNSFAIARAKSRNFTEEDKSKLKKSAFDFQALLINQMLQSFRETKFDDEEESDFGYGNEIMTSLFDMQLSSIISKSGKFGLAETIYENLTGEKLTQEAIKSIDQIESRANFRRPKTTTPAEVNTDNSSILDPYEINKNNLLKYKINVFDVINKYNSEIKSHSESYGVDPNLVKAIIATESSGNSNAISSANAKGLMQLIDSTAKDMGVKNIFNPSDNIMGGTKYIRSLIDRYNGDINLALAAYNAGPGAVDKYNGVPPYKETQNYVNRVLNYYSTIKAKEQELAINE